MRRNIYLILTEFIISQFSFHYYKLRIEIFNSIKGQHVLPFYDNTSTNLGQGHLN